MHSNSNSSNGNNSNAQARKQRTGGSTPSSDFLYLGTLVNSRRIDESSNSRANSRLDPRKMDSPELQPLPPLSRQAAARNFGEVGSVTEEEEEEFYSPGGSLSGAGSGSRRVFATIKAEELDVRSSCSSTCSCSSSSSGSQARSQSISISPPISRSPRRSMESMGVEASPQELGGDKNVQSPLLSLASTSPEYRGFMKNPTEETVRSPSLSSIATSPARNQLKATPPRSASSSSASTSPDRDVPANPDASPKTANVASPWPSSSTTSSPDASPKIVNRRNPMSPHLSLDRNLQSPSFSSASTSPDGGSDSSPKIYFFPPRSSASSSPERSASASPSPSPRVFGSSDCNKLSQLSSPARESQRNTDDNLVINSNGLEKPFSAPPPPPPPPPPSPLRPLQSQRSLENSVSSCASAQQMPKPPPLLPPSRPFMVQNPVNFSPIELPPSSESVDQVEDTPKPKLKPLHWDKVRASSDREMVWDHLRSSSFKLNEEMIETLFVVNTPNPKPKQATPRSVLRSPNQDNGVLDPKKAQNIAILLRALNVTVEEVCEALLEGNADTLGTELLESLLKMAPTKQEERKLKEYKDDSPVKLGPAEKFLKAVLDVPFAFERVDAMLYVANFESEVEYLKKSFETLEAACEELRSSRMFLKLLEAVLKTGNRMNVGTNRGDAHAFKLDTLLKLVDVKGADGKTTLLHFVVQEIIRTEGARSLSSSNQPPTSNSSIEDAKCRNLGLQVVSSLSSELTNVKKAAAMDSEVLGGDVSKLSKGLEEINEVLRLNETMAVDESTRKFSELMNKFMKLAEEEIIRIQAEESVALSLVKEITEYFHGNSAKEEAHPFRIFMVVRDFLTVLDRVCKEVGMINERTIVSSAHKFPVPVNPMLPQVFPVNPMMPQFFHGFPSRRQYGGSSDDDTLSP